ncbi:aconitase family protein [Cupriavidus basilensis]
MTSWGQYPRRSTSPPARRDRGPGRRSGHGQPGGADAAGGGPLCWPFEGVVPSIPDACSRRIKRAIEDRRNEDRFDFHQPDRTGKEAVPRTSTSFRRAERHPATRSTSSERMSPGGAEKRRRAPPRHAGRHRLPTTPMVGRSLGVIAIGVGGPEAESVMLGRASWMSRLRRTSSSAWNSTASRSRASPRRTPRKLALTEFLRKGKRSCRPYLEFFSAKVYHPLRTLGDRAITISNMAPEFGSTAAMFYIDEQTIKYWLCDLHCVSTQKKKKKKKENAYFFKRVA